MKIIMLVVAFCCLQSTHIFAQTTWTAGAYIVDFKIKNAGFTVNGSFKGLSATLKFDEGGANDYIEATIDATTVDTNNGGRDKHLRKADFFDVQKHPTIKLKSVSFTKISAGKFKGSFKLTMKGITKTVEIPFTFNKGTFEGEVKLNRLDYGVGESSWVMSNDVTIHVKIN